VNVPRTATEKMFGAKSGCQCSAHDVVGAHVDLLYLTDGSAPAVIDAFSKLGGQLSVGRPAVAISIDHYVPSPSALVTKRHQQIREFVTRTGCVLTEEGDGVCHQVLGEYGLVRAGDLVVGADSHTVTYGSIGAFATGIGTTDAAVAMASGRLWFRVPESIRLNLKGRLSSGVSEKDLALYLNAHFGTTQAVYRSVEVYTEDPEIDLSPVCNTSVEWGAKFCLDMRYCPLSSDPEVSYAEVSDVYVTSIEPLVALPHTCDSVVKVRDAGRVPVHMVVIGTCSGGRLKDLEQAAQVLENRRVNNNTRLLVVPASRRIFLECMQRGILQTLAASGAVVSPPGCGPCCGTSAGIPADGENVISTANRNLRGRMGNPKANIYLASPSTAAASAVAGQLADARDLE